MDPKRKKIYIVLIIVCFSLSAIILGRTFFSSPDAGPSLPDHFVAGQPAVNPGSPTGDVRQGFTAPSVFPSTDDFKTEVLESEAFQKLKTYTAIDVSGQLGRPDPFRSY